MEGSALLAAIVAAPDDDDPRLVYADWLSQQGDPRGELIAMQVRLARADADDVVLAERGRIETRIRALLKENADAWTAPLRAIAAATYTFRRGFVDRVADYADRNLGFVAEQLFAEAPLLRAARVTAGQLHSIVMNDASARFEDLVFVEPSLDIHMLALLTERLDGGALRSIAVAAPVIADRKTLDKLAAAFRVEHFGISASPHKGVQLSDSFVRALASAPNRDRLRSLHLANLSLGHIDALPTLLELTTLEVEGCRLARQYGNALKLVTAAPELRSLAIAKEPISYDELEEIVDACSHVRRLRLRQMGIADLAFLVPLAPQLRRLDLMGNPLSAAAVQLLIATEWPHLIELRLSMGKLPEVTHRALHDRFGDVLR